MKLSEAFPSNFLKAEDLKGAAVTVTINNVEFEKIGKGDEDKKLILSFQGKAKKLVCNKTNSKTIAKVLDSDDTDDWIGKKITLRPAEVEFQGEMIWSIRVSLQAPGTSTPPLKRVEPSDNDGANVEPDDELKQEAGF